MSSSTASVDATNHDQERAWDGPEGSYWAAHHERFEDCLARYQPPFLAAAAIRPTDRVLDVGCGTGASTRDAARTARAGHALGVDLSSRMIDVARRLAARDGLANASFERADAQVHDFGAAAFDVVISRTGAMFFGRPEPAFANLHRSLTAGGRLVLLTWQPPGRQEWIDAFSRALAGRTPPTADPTRPGPFSLSDPDRVRTLLRGAGFTDVDLTPLVEPMTYGRTVSQAHDFLIGLFGWMLEGQDERRRAESIEALRGVLESHLTADGVRFGSATWLVTARRAQH
ncbi:class I SAM-dependent methyltransferase [Pseudonocardia lacus]|uniref:class I SAM-dependent methyltransferase n=1 Tax=Pseudonocardia lacus TaxID=2835865 RepID=UPI001BDBDF2A|nr:class I SAM-dependent methyltransferase [Pseudonocardia lacus]